MENLRTYSREGTYLEQGQVCIQHVKTDLHGKFIVHPRDPANRVTCRSSGHSQVRNICQRYRKPESIICTDDRLLSLRADNGSQFTSEEFGTFLKTNGIQDRTSKHWPQLKRGSRRQNRTLLKALKIAQPEKKNLRVEIRKFLTAYGTIPHSSTGVSPAKPLFNREITSKIPELRGCEYIDSDTRYRDSEMKQRRTYYDDERRGAQENSLAPSDQVLMKQRQENKLSTTFEDTPYKVANKYGNEVTVTSPEGVSYKRNVTPESK